MITMLVVGLAEWTVWIDRTAIGLFVRGLYTIWFPYRTHTAVHGSTAPGACMISEGSRKSPCFACLYLPVSARRQENLKHKRKGEFNRGSIQRALKRTGDLLALELRGFRKVRDVVSSSDLFSFFSLKP